MVFLHSLLALALLHSVSCIQCPSCFDVSTNTSVASNTSICTLKSESAAICKSELFVELIDDYPAVINYITGPRNALFTDAGDSELIKTIHIPLDIGNPSASVTYDCFDQDLCNENVVEKQYQLLQRMNYAKLRQDLSELLFNNESREKLDDIECYSRNGRLEKCAMNGQCQATLVIGQGRPDSLSTRCISNRRPGSISGLVIKSSYVADQHQQTSISYICNKGKCNDFGVMKNARQMLLGADLVHSRGSSSVKVSTIIILATMMASGLVDHLSLC